MSSRNLVEPIDAEEQLNQIADELCGFREASFFEIMSVITEVKKSDSILKQSDGALLRRSQICEAVTVLMDELDDLQHGN